jgi:hypothetical protein
MLRIGTRTDRPAREVLEQAIAFFGLGSLGLELSHRGADHLTFQGGGGFVTVDVVHEDEHSDVTVITREWERDARQFISRL